MRAWDLSEVHPRRSRPIGNGRGWSGAKAYDPCIVVEALVVFGTAKAIPTGNSNFLLGRLMATSAALNAFRPFISGRASRVALTEDLVRYMRRQSGVWFTTCEEGPRWHDKQRA